MRKHSMAVPGIVFLALAVLSTGAMAVAPSEHVVEKLKASGQWEAYVERMLELRDTEGFDQPGEKILRSDLSLSGAVDTHHVLVILIDFADEPHNAGYVHADPVHFDSLLFSDALNPTGSMKNYYYENSYGQYVIMGTTVGWYNSPFNHEDYADADTVINPKDLVELAVQLADPDVDFSQFDNDGDYYVEGVIVVHAGTGYEESGDPTEIHSHASYIDPLLVDGVYVRRYTLQPEESALSHTISPIGVFCHEWGHVLGLPDLYDIDGSCSGVGDWSLMGSGNYNGGSKLPAHLDSWSKKELGWLFLSRIYFNVTGMQIPAVEYNPVAYQLMETIPHSEYWLVENRQKIGFDAGLPGEGLLIYHIDESIDCGTNECNRYDWHPRVFIEQADGEFELQGTPGAGGNRGDIGDPWPFGEAFDFNDKTTPNSRYYSDYPSQIAVWNISGSDSIMTADFDIEFSRPWLEPGVVIFRDDVGGDGDMKLEAGETIQVVTNLTNEWGEATDIQVTMTSDDPALGIIVSTVGFGTLSTNETANNSMSPFEFEIPLDMVSRVDSFYFDVTANGGDYHSEFGAEAAIGLAQVLIVDDDGGDEYNLEYYLAEPLYKNRTPSTIWSKALSGSPDSADLAAYEIVMWTTGRYRENLLNAADIQAMKGFLNAGGNLLYTGQGLALQLSTQDNDFLTNYLKVAFVDTLQANLDVMVAAEDPALALADKFVVIKEWPDTNGKVFDHVLPAGDGRAEWKYNKAGDYGAISHSGDFKTVFCAFNFESLNYTDTSRFETPWGLMGRILDFFRSLPVDADDNGGPVAGLPNRLELKQNFPNPFNPRTTISYTISDDIRNERTRIVIYNILGQPVRILVDRYEGSGDYSITWDGTDDKGSPVASGVYLYRLTRGEREETRKMTLLK